MRPGTCIHFTGLRDRESCCKAGMNYAKEFDIDRPGVMLRLPCIQYHTLPAHGRGTYIKPGDPTIRKEVDRRDQAMMPCAHFREPTEDEVRRDREESEAHLRKTMAAIKVASEWRVKPKPEQSRHEVVECPVCNGRLHLSQSAYNGHVHGKCETDGCVSWME
jgi:hypothetical protein